MAGVLAEEEKEVSQGSLISSDSNPKCCRLNERFSSFRVHLSFVRGKGKQPPREVGYQDAAMQLVVC